MTCRRCTLSLLAAVALIAGLQVPSSAQFGGFGFGGVNSRQPIVERFDTDGDGVLNREERDAARRAIGSGAGGFGGGRGFRGQSGRPPAPGPRVTPADVRPPYPTTPLYDQATLRTIFLTFEHDDWEEEMEAFYNTDVQIPVTMVVDGRTYRDVGVRFRGASSFRFAPAGYKRPLRLKTDLVHDGQDLHGYRTLNLLNGANDATFLRSFLYAEISRHYVPTPKVNFVRVVINGESWGVYVNQQQFNNDFVEDWFDVRRGARWKAPGSPGGRAGLEYLGDSPAPYRNLFEIDTRDSEESWAALARMTKILNQTPLDQLEAALEPVLNVDGALRFLAVDMALVNADGYWTRASDFYLYMDVDGRFHILPHDMNEGFGAEGGGRGGGFGGGRGPDLDPLIGLNDPSKPLRSRLLAVPALRERYLGYVREIATEWLDWNRVAPMLRSTHEMIAADVLADTRKLYDNAGFNAGVAESGNALKTFLDRRRAYLLGYTDPRAVRLE
jgi:hypothetical protein